MLFGAMPMDPKGLLQFVISEVPSLPKDESKTEWTRATKEVLCNLGQEKGFRPYASIRLGKELLNEWLLDVVWYSSEQKGGVQLAVESELGDEENILYDFEKLMCIKAPLKLMLVESGRAQLVERLEDYLREFEQHIEGKTYLLVDFHHGYHECYDFSVKRNGKQKKSEVKFRKITSLCGPDRNRPN